jgi:dihydrofolate reductase
MRHVIYEAAVSLDSFIARPDGSVSWIPDDPDMDFGEIFSRFDVLLMGRKTYDVGKQLEAETGMDLIDEISIALCPVLLGSGIPMFGSGFPERKFRCAKQRLYSKSGIVRLEFVRA